MRLIVGLCILTLLAPWRAAGVQAADLPGAWVQLRPDGALDVRAVVAPGAACPKIVADGVALAAAPRGAADAAYPLQVCAAMAPANARAITVGGLPAPVLAKALNRIVILGDTGCRLKGAAVQDCNDPAAWPFDTVARLAAARHPDLVIHVGDYHYRESPCPPGRPGCAGSPSGDNWAAWKADFFDPAAPLLAAAPWVLVRGNHEACDRGGIGWFRLLDPRPATVCTAMTEPYALSLDRLHLLLLDSAAADDITADPASVAAYRAQFETLLGKIGPDWRPAPIWLLTHRPIWSLAQGGAPVGSVSNITQQAAIRGIAAPRLDMIVSGHIHDFATYDFAGQRPAQLVVGEGGDSRDATIQQPMAGQVLDGVAIRRAATLAEYGFLVLDRAGAGWRGAVIGLDGGVLARCRFNARTAECEPTGHSALHH